MNKKQGRSTKHHVNVFNRWSMPFEPKRPGDVGHDLTVCIPLQDMRWWERLIRRILNTSPFIIILPFQIRMVRSGIHLMMQNNTWCDVRARSSTARKKLVVIGGIIDSGFNGEMFTVLHNVGFRPRIIRAGERYSQAIFHRAIRPTLHDVDERSFGEAVRNQGVDSRKEDGFGSTGQ